MCVYCFVMIISHIPIYQLHYTFCMPYIFVYMFAWYIYYIGYQIYIKRKVKYFYMYQIIICIVVSSLLAISQFLYLHFLSNHNHPMVIYSTRYLLRRSCNNFSFTFNRWYKRFFILHGVLLYIKIQQQELFGRRYLFTSAEEHYIEFVLCPIWTPNQGRNIMKIF